MRQWVLPRFGEWSSPIISRSGAAGTGASHAMAVVGMSISKLTQVYAFREIKALQNWLDNEHSTSTSTTYDPLRVKFVSLERSDGQRHRSFIGLSFPWRRRTTTPQPASLVGLAGCGVDVGCWLWAAHSPRFRSRSHTHSRQPGCRLPKNGYGCRPARRQGSALASQSHSVGTTKRLADRHSKQGLYFPTSSPRAMARSRSFWYFRKSGTSSFMLPTPADRQPPT